MNRTPPRTGMENSFRIIFEIQDRMLREIDRIGRRSEAANRKPSEDGEGS